MNKQKFQMWVNSYTQNKQWIVCPDEVRQFDSRAADLFTEQVNAANRLRQYLLTRTSEK